MPGAALKKKSAPTTQTKRVVLMTPIDNDMRCFKGIFSAYVQQESPTVSLSPIFVKIAILRREWASSCFLSWVETDLGRDALSNSVLSKTAAGRFVTKKAIYF
jgi:hypothetical protein